MRTLSFLAATLAGGAALAEPVETALLPDPDAPRRLILAHWPSDGWVVRQRGETAEIRFPGLALDIDLAAVSAGVAQGLIAGAATAMHEDGTELRLVLDCDCSVAVTGDGEARLAIDIVGADLPAGPALRARSVAPEAAPVPPRRGAPGAAAAIRDDAAGQTDGAPETGDLALVRDRLIVQLERAAEAGIIRLEAPLPVPEHRPPGRGASEEPSEAPPGEVVAVATPGSEQAVVPGAAAQQPHPAAPSTSGTAPAAEGDETRPAPATPGTARPDRADVPEAETPRCHADREFVLPPATRGQAFADLLAEYNRHLLGEFDRPDPVIAVALARHHLANGLGQEAEDVLAEFAPDAREAPLLTALARAIEDAPQADPAVLAAEGCGGAHSVWRALAATAGGAGPPAPAALPTGALEAFDEPLRSTIAERLGLAALDRGDVEAARAMRAVARRGDRAGHERGARRLLLDAGIARADGDAGRALADLRRVWGGNGPEADDALLALAQMVASGELAEAGDTRLLRSDLGALSLVEGGSALGERAALAEAELTLRALGRDAAIELVALAHAEGRLSAEARDGALRDFGARENHDPEAEPLAVLHAADPERFAGALSDPTFRAALARSYAGIGLPGLGEALLGEADLADPGLVGDIARGHLAAAGPDAAARLAGHLPEGAERASIEAAALEALGRPAEALARLVAAETGSPADRARLAWAAGDWPAAAAALEALLAEPDAALPSEVAGSDPSDRAEIAAQLALALRRAGGAVLPGPARTALADVDPALRDAMDALADPSGAAATDFEATPAGIRRLLEALRVEAAAIREIMDRG
jgi:hypothetical protein